MTGERELGFLSACSNSGASVAVDGYSHGGGDEMFFLVGRPSGVSHGDSPCLVPHAGGFYTQVGNGIATAERHWAGRREEDSSPPGGIGSGDAFRPEDGADLADRW